MYPFKFFGGFINLVYNKAIVGIRLKKLIEF